MQLKLLPDYYSGLIPSYYLFLAMLGSIVIASLSVFWMLNKFKVNPALSGSVVLTTVTDILGFITFLGLGSLLLF